MKSVSNKEPRKSHFDDTQQSEENVNSSDSSASNSDLNKPIKIEVLAVHHQHQRHKRHPNKPIKIEVLAVANEKVVESINSLIRQLSSNPVDMTLNDLSKIIRSPNSFLIVSQVREDIIGMLTLIVIRIPTGIKAFIEDVVVDERFRGQSIGEKLVEKATEIARQEGSHSIDLTSKPSRVAANELYKKVGFKQRETNVYRLKF